MKTVLCFGDSNTWGYEPGTGLRYDESTRWTSLTPMLLENEVSFYEAGLSGRTTNSCDSERDFRRGTELLKLYLESCRPLSLVIINLGTNDLKKSLQLSVEEIQSGARLLCKQALEFDYSPYDKPQVMLVAPAPLVNSPDLDEEFEQLELENSRKLATTYYQLCQELGIHFLNAGQVVKTSPLDGVHWDEAAHQDFARHLAEVVRAILLGDSCGCIEKVGTT
ncbi:arylesterase [Pseudoalteromonas phenolica]|uniref:Arylesterase n=1 Tax=Pseudoalteromonas phenolica TaxID=161398 RepID=A0A4Q7IKA8_9GAMM|nr:GDSL-type esterase/lipase family protein [Pseudoalteromonas phenolica]RZQ51357.1 arylesterase [Pseudoalteromonas phenolica]